MWWLDSLSRTPMDSVADDVRRIISEEIEDPVLVIIQKEQQQDEEFGDLIKYLECK